MSERSLIAFQAGQEATQKFDYFVTGLTGALFAYVAQTYKPQKLELGIAAMEPLALVLLVISFYLGLKRIESTNVGMRFNHDALDAEEKAGKAAKALGEHSGLALNTQTGQFATSDDIHQQWLFFRAKSEAARGALERIGVRVERLYRYRNLTLIAGFIVLLAAKILQPYA